MPENVDSKNLSDIEKEKSEAKVIHDIGNFLLPDMGDYCEDDMTLEYINNIGGAISANNRVGLSFYSETPVTEELGFIEESRVFVVKPDLAWKSKEMDYIKDNAIDGDTFPFYVDDMQDGGKSFNIGDQNYSNVKEYLMKHLNADVSKDKLDEKTEFEVRFLGVDAPEIPHYGYHIFKKGDKIIKKDSKILKSLDTKEYIFEKVPLNSDGKLKKRSETTMFLQKKSDKDSFIIKYYEILSHTSPKEGEDIKIVVKEDNPFDEEYAFQGRGASDRVIELMKDAQDLRIVLDASTISKNRFFKRSEYDDNFFNNMTNIFVHPIESSKRLYDKYIRTENRGNGYNAYGMDIYKRTLGVIYIKPNERHGLGKDWINLSKLIISEFNKAIPLPDFSGDPFVESQNGFSSDAFKLWSYDIKNNKTLDATNINIEDLDKRKELQEKIMGKSFDHLLDWTVMIGDNMFMVPPTSIRIVTQSESQRMNLLRSKGALTTSSNKTNRLIEMTLFFNEDEGINGVPFYETLSGKTENADGNIEDIKTTYYMNGLRSLIAMFKFTPFLPIENTYLNDVLNIDAVTLANIQISTSPDYPKCLSAVLTLQDFDYRVYMPELPVPDLDKEESINKNMFASTINYEAMRYYYQQCIRRGEELRDIDFGSQEYLKKTLGDKTALQPMKFENSEVDFYIINEGFLKEKMQIKLESTKKSLRQLEPIHEEQKEYRDNYLIPTFKITDEILYNENIETELSNIWNDYDHGKKEKESYINNKFSRLNVRDLKVKEVSKDSKGNECKGFSIEFNVKNEGLQDAQVKSLLKNYAEEFGETIDAFEKTNFKALIITNHESPDQYFIDIEDKYYQLLKTISTADMYTSSSTPGEINQDNILNIQNGNVKESENSLKFDKYPIGNIRIKSIASIFGNNFSNIDLQLSDGYAPQYVGGQDTIIEVQIETTDENAVNLINLLPKKAAMLTRQYREVLNVYPLRVDSEITRLLGVNEVVIESVDISTVPQFPGLYNISLKLISVDRTLRNKESLTKVDKPDNSGSTVGQSKSNTTMKDFFDIKKSLAETEIYPDLELPTILELERFGFKFIKYSNKNNYRAYPDPDFYFYYGHVLGNAILRETILEFLKENTNIEQEFELSDIDGASVNIKPSNDGAGYIVSKKNFLTKENEDQDKNNKEAQALLNKSKKKKTIDEIKDKSNRKIQDLNDELIDEEFMMRWNISDRIKCHYREKKYDQVFEDKDKNATIKQQLDKKSKEIIDEINKILSKKIDYKGEFYNFQDLKTPKRLKTVCENFTQTDFKKVLQLIAGEASIEYSDIGNMLYAIACSRTGSKEYEGKGNNDTWQAQLVNNKKSNVPYCIIEGGFQDLNKKTFATSIEDALTNGTVFGAFGIRAYTKEEIEKIIKEPSSGKFKDHFIDPYYRDSKRTKKELDKYKKGILTNAVFSIEAIYRESLYWMKKLLEDRLLISYYDITSVDAVAKINEVTNEQVEELYGYQFSQEEIKREEKLREVAKTLKKYIEKDKDSLGLGKLFTGFLLTASEGNPNMYSNIANREYSVLNNYIDDIKRAKIGNEGYDDSTLKLRKFIRALVATGTIKSEDKIGHSDKTGREELENIASKSMFLAAAEEPMVYLSHSFYDMIVNDKRGRMVKAFPTYYMMLIDEGREIGYWKLHDNFYNMSAISEFQIVKSRKIAADTATITMSNMYSSFDKDDDNLKVDETYTYKDVFKSIFSPREYATSEDNARKQADPISSVFLKPGVRIHLRMGYSANASMLPILFNGSIAEVSAGESMEIIAQGDGVELTNPIMSSAEAEDVQFEDNFAITKLLGSWLTEGATPRTILTSLLTTEGGFFKSMAKKISNGRFFNNNPYGIEHFGDKNFDRIFSQGEVVQNIYEAMEKPSWGKKEHVRSDIMDDYSTKDAPRLSTQVFGKSYWDIMHICASTSPDYITSVVPFQYRSSIFFGQPRYYYAFDYEKDANGIIKEKRKPFQQYHIYTSYSDIVRNNIKASDKDVKTCAIGLYERTGVGGKKNQSKVGPLYVDIDINPEKQKTMVVDTQLISKGTVLGDAIPYLNVIQDELADGKGIFQGGKEIAWRMTASALKDSIKEMYKGKIIVLGDPSVKPYDRIWVHDVYERMSGAMEVEAVVHNFSIEDGFITSVYPDCISTIDDRHERIAQSVIGSTVAKAVGAYAGVIATTMAFAKNTKPLLTAVTGYASSLGTTSEKHINNLLKLIGKDDLTANKYLEKVKGVQGFFGISHNGVEYDKLTRAVSVWGNSLTSIDEANKLSEISKGFTKMNKSLESLNTEEMINLIKTSGIKDVDGTITSVTGQLDDINLAINSAISNIKIPNMIIDQNDINLLRRELGNFARLTTDDTARKGAIKAVENIKNLNKVSNPKELKIFTESLQYIDDASKLGDISAKTKHIHNAILKSDEIIKATSNLAASDKWKKAGNLLNVAKSSPKAIMIGLALELAITIVITSFINEYIERWLKNLQVLQVFPIKKEGQAYTAGLDGSKGLVVGSPTEFEEGAVTTWAGNIFGKDITFNGPLDSVKSILVTMFATNKMRELGQKYRRKNGLPAIEGSSSEREHMVGNLLRYKASDEARKSDAYNAAVIQPRFTKITTEENGRIKLTEQGKKYYLENAIQSDEGIGNNQKVTEKLIYLNEYNAISKYIKEESLILAHKQPKNIGGTTSFKFGGKSIDIEYIQDGNTKDYPFLHNDAVLLLKKIIEKTKTEIYPDNIKQGEKSDFLNNPLQIESSLRVGEKSLAATGLHFRLVSTSKNNTEKVLKDIQKENKDVYEIYKDKDSKYFEYVSSTSKDSSLPMFDITVYPPVMIKDYNNI